MEADSVSGSDLGASEILRGRSLVNRHLYQQKITDAVEAQSEQVLPTTYTAFDTELGLGRLQDDNGNIFYGDAQTNGAVGKGDNIRLRRGGVFAKYDAMPRRKPALTRSDKPLKPSKGFLFFLDKDILNIDDVENEAENILTFTAIFKYFTANRKNIYTLKYDSRFGITSGLIPQNGVAPSSVLSKVVKNMNLKVIEIDLSKTSQIETFLYLPFPSFNYPRTGDFSDFFTDTEKSNLKKIAASSGLIAVGDIFYETYHSYLLNIFKLNKRITTITPLLIDPISFYLNSNTSILKNYIKNNRLAYNATAIFQGARKSEIVMMASGKPSMILITNL